jgi:hypothetical protein
MHSVTVVLHVYATHVLQIDDISQVNYKVLGRYTLVHLEIANADIYISVYDLEIANADIYISVYDLEIANADIYISVYDLEIV